MADYRLTQSGDEVQSILNNSTPQSDLTAETQRAELAEQTLQGNIDIEERDRKAADVTLQGNIDAEETRAKAAEKQNADDIDAIEEKIPNAASSQNQLADKQFVNQSIATATAEFKGSFNLVTDLHLTVSATRLQIAAALPNVIASADNNDYAFVMIPTADASPTEIASVERYKFNGSAWAFEYALNNSGFTQAQWNALNSGITSGLVSKLTDLPTNAALTTLLNGKQDNLTFDNVPVQNSNNPVKSGGVYSAIDAEKTARENADTTLQGNIDDEETRAKAAELALGGRVTTIEGKIPAAATDQNQLADKNYVNSSIATNTANFKGSFNEVSDLQLTVSATRSEIATTLGGVISGADNNDYAFVQIPTADVSPTEIARVERYKFNGSAWAFEYAMNNSGFTSAQWEALNSGITSGLVSKLTLLPSASDLSTQFAGKQDVISDLSTIRSGASDGATAVQPAALVPITTDINTIESKIPTEASSSNQLADKDFVNSSIATNTATYRGSYNLVSDLSLTISATEQQIATALAGAISTADNNDYCFVQIPTADDTPTVIARVDRYKYNGTAWALEYTLNSSGFTAAQWAALNSGITSGLVSKLSDLPTNSALTALLAAKYEKPSGGIPDTDLSAALQAAIASFITNSTQNLVYYYLKSETYSAAQVDAIIAALKQFQYEVVQTLPTASAETMGTIYLIPGQSSQQQNVKDEYITLSTNEGGTTTYYWELIGQTTIDLSNYYTKTQTDAVIASALQTALADYSTTTQVGTIVSTAITTALANYYTKTQVDNELAKKTDKLTMTGAGAAVEDDIMVIDENGNIKDGGKKISDLQLKVTDCAMLGGGFPTCTTAGGTAAKTVSISNFLLLPNCRISVLFQNAFTASNPTLSINSGAAIAIRHFGRAMEIGKVHANTILTMVYDGTYWQVVGIEGITGSTPSGAVDLALPSGLLWCEHNVGAASPYEHGLYFSWGNVTGHAEGSGYDFSDAVYANTDGAALTGNIAVGNEYDMARHNMGAPWRLPTVGEFQELNSNCSSEWTDEDGVAGRRFTSNHNGNSIFFPASGYYGGMSLNGRGSFGYYWSSSYVSETNAYLLYFYSGGVNPAYYDYRRYGFSVRAVQ